MGYVTASELALAMSQPRLADCCDDTVEGTADDPVVADVIARASGVVDGYLQTAGYVVPLTGASITPALRHWTAMVCAHFAAQRRPAFRDAQGNAPYRREYLDAVAWLEKVAARQILLEGLPPESNGNTDQGGGGMVLHAWRGQQAPPARPRSMRGW